MKALKKIETVLFEWKYILADRLCLGFKLYSLGQYQMPVREAGQAQHCQSGVYRPHQTGGCHWVPTNRCIKVVPSAAELNALTGENKSEEK